MKSKLNQKLQNILLNTVLSIGMTMAISGIALSFILISNKYFGKQTFIDINETVLAYNTGKTKHGRRTHSIKFIHPISNKPIWFSKTMNIGYWGILYADK